MPDIRDRALARAQVVRRAFHVTLRGVPALRLLCAVWIFLLAQSIPSGAQPVASDRRDEILDRMAASSTLVIRGRVEATESRAHAGAIYTYATVTVDEVLKGPDSIQSLVVKTLGGATDGVVLQVPDAPRFASGDEAVMFLAPRPADGTLYPVALAEGVWPVSLDLAGRGPQAGRGDLLGPLDATFGAGDGPVCPDAPRVATRQPGDLCAADDRGWRTGPMASGR